MLHHAARCCAVLCRQEQQLLLNSLLPQRLIKQMAANDDWQSSFDRSTNMMMQSE